MHSYYNKYIKIQSTAHCRKSETHKIQTPASQKCRSCTCNDLRSEQAEKNRIKPLLNSFIFFKYKIISMTSLDDLIAKAKELKSDGHSISQIADELSLSIDTITWLITQGGKGMAAPKDVHIDWTNVSSSTKMMQGLADMMADYVMHNCENCDEIDTVVGISACGIPLSALIGADYDLNFSIYHPSKHNPENGTGSISGKFSKITGKKCLIIDDCITTGNTITELIAYLRRHKAEAIAACVIFDKRDISEIDGVPVYSLFKIKRLD